MDLFKYRFFTRKLNTFIIVTSLIFLSLTSIIFLTNTVKADFGVFTFESDYNTPKNIFLQGESVYIIANTSKTEHLKLRIIDPNDNIAYSSYPVYSRKITCSWTLHKNAPVGEWVIQLGTFEKGYWYWIPKANFSVIASQKYNLVVSIDGFGKVVKDLDSGIYNFGTLVNLSAVGEYGWIFDYWSGDIIGNENPTIINMTSNKTVVAHFKRNTNIEGGSSGENQMSDEDNMPPVAHFSAGLNFQGFVNSTITFDGSLSSDADGSIISWNWDFGDGSTGEGETTTHSYSAIGEYQVVLTVTDNNGFTDLLENWLVLAQQSTQPIDSEVNSPVMGNRESLEEIQGLFILVLFILIPLIPIIIFIKLIKQKNKGKPHYWKLVD